MKLRVAIEEFSLRLEELGVSSLEPVSEVELEKIPMEEMPAFVAEPPGIESASKLMLPSRPVGEAAAVPVAEKSFEMLLGRVWLGRIGVAVLVTGLVLLGNFAYQNFVHKLPPILKLLFLYGGAGILAGTGIFVRKKDSTALFGEVLLSGGLAFGY